jgi:hypothetical protein
MPSNFDDFKFPDEQDEKDPGFEVETEGQTEELAIEVEDDTPEEDRGRKPADPPEEVSDDELSAYDEKVQKRIKKFTRGYHDERRAKEAALREREAAEALARQLLEENKHLQRQLSSGSEMYISEAKTAAEAELNAARRAYKEAYEAGDSDKMVEAQESLQRATMKLDKVSSMKPLQVQEKEVQIPQAQRTDSRAAEWQAENRWFGKNRAMTAFALGLHAELVEEKGIDPNSDRYYQLIDGTMRKKFPEHFGSDEGEATSKTVSEPAEDDESPRRATKPAAVVAPATRSTPPNRVKLKQSEVQLAKRLGIPLELYAKKVAELRKGQ